MAKITIATQKMTYRNTLENGDGAPNLISEGGANRSMGIEYRLIILWREQWEMEVEILIGSKMCDMDASRTKRRCGTNVLAEDGEYASARIAEQVLN